MTIRAVAAGSAFDFRFLVFNHKLQIANHQSGGAAQPAISLRRAGKENEITIGIQHDEGFGAPGLVSHFLVEAYSGGLVTRKKLFDLLTGSNRERSGEQMLTLPDIAGEYGFADRAQRKARMVTGDLRIEWRIAMDEVHLEAELIGIEVARGFDVSDEQLRSR
jgi:hypothetical protein